MVVVGDSRLEKQGEAVRALASAETEADLAHAAFAAMCAQQNESGYAPGMSDVEQSRIYAWDSMATVELRTARAVAKDLGVYPVQELAKVA